LFTIALIIGACVMENQATLYGVTDAVDSRSARLASQFEAAHEAFTRLVESVTDERWMMIGSNHPKRINDEDEGRSVGVIAHHAAISGDTIMKRIQIALERRPLPPIDVRVANARHSVEHAQVSQEEVLRILRESGPRLTAALRAIPDEELDEPRDTPVGPMSIAQRVEMVLIGHLQQHKGSIEATIAPS
jgi:DinB superfamily